MDKNSPIYAIVGPTASGKTEIGVELALKIGNAEIINCDSVQVYREIEIATAKPSEGEMKGVPHRLLNFVPPETNYTAADWAADASDMIKDIESRGKTPILVGGTGFYLRTLRQPIFESPKPDEKLRNRLQQIAKDKGAEHLHKLLTRIDPKSAEKMFPKDYVRTMRALEVFLQTGKRMSELQIETKEPPEFAKRIIVCALNPPREQLYQRINLRAEKHFEDGLVEEVIALRKKGIRDETSALGAHGYRRVCEYLRGERTLESAVEQTKQDVRNYSKRQITWFRKEDGVRWLEGFGNDRETQVQLWRVLEIDET